MAPSDPWVEGWEFRRAIRWPGRVLLVVTMGVVTLATWTAPRPARGADPRASAAVFDLALLPLLAYTLTSRLSLEGGTLVSRSLFGTRRLPLAEVRRARVESVTNKGVTHQHLVLEGPTTLRVVSDAEGYEALRDAILAGLPPGVRPA